MEYGKFEPFPVSNEQQLKMKMKRSFIALECEQRQHHCRLSNREYNTGAIRTITWLCTITYNNNKKLVIQTDGGVVLCSGGAWFHLFTVTTIATTTTIALAHCVRRLLWLYCVHIKAQAHNVFETEHTKILSHLFEIQLLFFLFICCFFSNDRCVLVPFFFIYFFPHFVCFECVFR